MTTKYAKDQPSGFTNRIERVAVVGAGGSVGGEIAKALLGTGKHTVTALTRPGSKSKMPEGAKIIHIDYDDESSLVSALQGQQFLVITMAVQASPENQPKLVRAAAKANIPYVMPNSYGMDTQDEKFAKETIAAQKVRDACADIESVGVSSWVALNCGFWYEMCLLTGPEWFGFDFGQKKVTFSDDGTTKINISTWEQCGRAVASFLSLKELPEDENDQSPTVSSWANKPIYISSFLINQKDMFESWKRVSGDKDADWEIGYEPTAERYERGLERMRAGETAGYSQAMQARTFYPSGEGDFEHRYGLDNAVLGLPSEDLDERTRVAKKMMESGYSYFGRS